MSNFSKKILSKAKEIAQTMKQDNISIASLPLSKDSQLYISKDPKLIIGSTYVQVEDEKYWIGYKAA